MKQIDSNNKRKSKENQNKENEICSETKFVSAVFKIYSGKFE